MIAFHALSLSSLYHLLYGPYAICLTIVSVKMFTIAINDVYKKEKHTICYTSPVTAGACVILNNRLSVSVEKFSIGTSLKISQLINNGDFYFILFVLFKIILNWTSKMLGLTLYKGHIDVFALFWFLTRCSRMLSDAKVKAFTGPLSHKAVLKQNAPSQGGENSQY